MHTYILMGFEKKSQLAIKLMVDPILHRICMCTLHWSRLYYKL